MNQTGGIDFTETFNNGEEHNTQGLKQPKSEMNRGVGSSRFALQSVVESDTYLNKDTICVTIAVDTDVPIDQDDCYPTEESTKQSTDLADLTLGSNQPSTSGAFSVTVDQVCDANWQFSDQLMQF